MKTTARRQGRYAHLVIKPTRENLTKVHNEASDQPSIAKVEISPTVTFTLYESSKALSKVYSIEAGQIKKQAAAQMTSGTASRLEMPFSEFANALTKQTDKQAFGYGVHALSYPDKVTISTKARANPDRNIISRSLDYFQYSGAGVVMIDHDPSEYGQTFTPVELLAALVAIHPEIAQAAQIVRGSVSAGVHKVGEQPLTGEGFHVYIPVINAGDIPRYGKVLFDRLWLAGLGYIALSSNGGPLVRTAIDGAVFSPERLDFVGRPVIDGTLLTWTAPEVSYTEGQALYTVSLPDLTTDERATVGQLQAEAKAAIKPKGDIKRAEWAAAKIEEMQQGGATVEQAEQVVDLILSTDCRDLYDDFMLEFSGALGVVTVSAVLADPRKYDRKALSDPVEGKGYGLTTAMFYWNNGVKPYINSMAHGGARYFLHSVRGEFEVVPVTSTYPPIKPIATGRLVYSNPKTQGQSLIIESAAALILSECLRGRVAYCSQVNAWYRFTGTHWQALPGTGQVDRELLELIYPGSTPIGFKNAYKNNIKALIADGGFLPLPEANHDLLPFQNGLLDYTTRTLHPITPDNAQTWSLPYAYQEQADCPNIKGWLLQALDGDHDAVAFLRAWLAALLHGRPDLQKFLHLIGSGGTGKGTLLRLATALVGEHNAVSTTLKEMETNRFEPARYLGARLVKITDSDKYGGSINMLKAMTGQDHIRIERKNQQQTGDFIFSGLVVMASNEHLATTDHTSGLDRRRLTVVFDRRATDEEKALWDSRGGEETVLHSEMPGLVNWLLELSREETTEIIRNPPKSTEKANFEAMTAANPLAEWVTTNCIPDPEAWAQIGVKNEISKQHLNEWVIVFEHSDQRLYPNYLTWCREHGRNPQAVNNFRANLTDTLKTLNVDVTVPPRRAEGQGLIGIRLRRVDEGGFSEFNSFPGEVVCDLV